MESEFDTYKLSRCMCPSNYNRFWNRARYLWKKTSFYHTPLHSTPPLGGFPSEYRHPVWHRKTRMVGLPDGEKNEDIYNGLDIIRTCDRQTDRQTDGHLATTYTRYAYASRSKNAPRRYRHLSKVNIAAALISYISYERPWTTLYSFLLIGLAV